jgi:hypothetical protein
MVVRSCATFTAWLSSPCWSDQESPGVVFQFCLSLCSSEISMLIALPIKTSLFQPRSREGLPRLLQTRTRRRLSIPISPCMSPSAATSTWVTLAVWLQQTSTPAFKLFFHELGGRGGRIQPLRFSHPSSLSVAF